MKIFWEPKTHSKVKKVAKIQKILLFTHKVIRTKVMNSDLTKWRNVLIKSLLSGIKPVKASIRVVLNIRRCKKFLIY